MARAGIALLTPYHGGNFGDGAIQEAAIFHLRRRIPGAALVHVTLDPRDTQARHGITAHPLTRDADRDRTPVAAAPADRPPDEPPPGPRAWIKAAARRGLGPAWDRARTAALGARTLREEAAHWMRARGVCRDLAMLLVAGGGQIDDLWDGPWGHPYALYKWCTLARAAGADVAFLSVGASDTKAPLSRWFARAALRTAGYRSCRDARSKAIVDSLDIGGETCIVPDLAFSLPLPDGAAPERRDARPVVGVSPMCYGRPQRWPRPDVALYHGYLDRLAAFVSRLLREDHDVVLFHSAVADRPEIDEVLRRLDPDVASRRERQVSVPSIAHVGDLIARLRTLDCVVATRLHGVLLSYVTGRPVLAISYDPKVDTLLLDLGQSQHRVDVHDFSVPELWAAFVRLRDARHDVAAHVRRTVLSYRAALDAQYDHIATRLGSLRPGP
jgi:polysaccharide pyruvyl transferase WcaK-like protein